MTFVYQIPSRLLFYKDRGQKTLTINPILNASGPNVGKYISGNFTVVGSPTITDDGIASGFSSSNYVNTTSCSIAEGVSSISYTCKLIYSTASNTAKGTKIFVNTGLASLGITVRFGINNSNNALQLDGLNNRFDSISLGTTLKDNDIIDATFTFSSNSVKIVLYINGVLTLSTTKAATIDSLSLNNEQLMIGSQGNYFWTGSIDLKQFSITVDGTEVFRGSYPTPDPDETVVTLTSAGKTVISKTGSYIKGSTVAYDVSHPYFTSASGSTRMTESKTIPITINEYAWYTLTINPSQSGSTIAFTSEDGYQSGSNTFRVHDGSSITYKVEKIGYVTVTDSIVLTEDTTIDITQSLSWMIYSGDSYTGEQSTDANYDLGLDS